MIRKSTFFSVPQEIIKPTNLYRVFSLLFITFLLVILSNWMAIAFLERTTESENKWIMLSHLMEPVDVIILGDSAAFYGVDPDVLNQKLNKSFLNLGTWANLSAMNDAWLLQSYIDRFGPPKAVIIARYFINWKEGFDRKAGLQIPLSIREWNKLNPLPPKDWRYLLQRLVTRYIPLYAFDRTFRSVASSPVSAFISFTQLKDSPDSGSRGQFRYLNVHSSHLSNQLNDFQKEMDHRMDLTISKENLSGIERIRQISESFGFPVFIVEMPLLREVNQIPGVVGIRNNLAQQLKKTTEGSRFVRYHTGTFILPESHFYDLTHVNYWGAIKYSSFLAKILAQRSQT